MNRSAEMRERRTGRRMVFMATPNARERPVANYMEMQCFDPAMAGMAGPSCCKLRQTGCMVWGAANYLVEHGVMHS